MKDKHVIAVYDDKFKAQKALTDLQDRGFDADKLSLLLSDEARDHHFEIDKNKSKTAEGVAYGALLGGLLSGLGAAAAGLVSVVVPGAILVTGPLAAAFAAGVGGAAVGGLAGGLIGIGVPADEVKLVEEDLGRGGLLVAAHSIDEDAAELATEIFKKSGAVRVH